MREVPARARLLDHLRGRSRHTGAVALLARLIAPEESRRELVVSTFEVAHVALRRLRGPSEAFRPYVLLTARRLHEEARVTPDPGTGEVESPLAGEFRRLPETWQLLVWQLEVELDSVDDAAAWVGVPPVVVPALVESARATLRRQLLAQHRSRTLPPVCLAHALRLVRAGGGRSPRAVMRHAADCERCAVLLGNLDAVRSGLGEEVARQLLGPAGGEYLAARRIHAGVG